MKVKIKCVGTVNNINTRQDLQYISDSQEVNEIKSILGFKNRFDSFFVKVNNGDMAIMKINTVCLELSLIFINIFLK